MSNSSGSIIKKISEASEDQLLVDLQLLDDLKSYINHLILHDFEYLVSLLYRIDVNENKLRSILEDRPQEDAANGIAKLIIERQLQKIQSKKKYTRPRNEDDAEELW